MKWVKVNPADYDLEDLCQSLECAISLELEVGLRVQVLRLKPIVSERTVKRRLEDAETWSRASVTSTDLYVYVALFHEN
jgi:hypothetical protein